MKVDVQALVIDPRLQARAHHEPDALAEYYAAYASKVRLPPLQAYRVDGELHVVDGFHRLAAAINAGLGFVAVDVVGEGSIDDAVWYATGVNQAHGIRRTRADKRRAVEMAVSSSIGLEQSSSIVASHVGVSREFVSRVRTEWEAGQRAAGADLPDTTVDTLGRRQPKRRVTEAHVEPETSPDGVIPKPGENEDNPAESPENAPVAKLPDYGRTLEHVAAGFRLARREAAKCVPAELVSLRQRVEHASRGIEAALKLAAPVEHAKCGGSGCPTCGGRGWVTAGDAAR